MTTARKLASRLLEDDSDADRADLPGAIMRYAGSGRDGYEVERHGSQWTVHRPDTETAERTGRMIWDYVATLKYYPIEQSWLIVIPDARFQGKAPSFAEAMKLIVDKYEAYMAENPGAPSAKQRQSLAALAAQYTQSTQADQNAELVMRADARTMADALLAVTRRTDESNESDPDSPELALKRYTSPVRLPDFTATDGRVWDISIEWPRPQPDEAARYRIQPEVLLRPLYTDNSGARRAASCLRIDAAGLAAYTDSVFFEGDRPVVSGGRTFSKEDVQRINRWIADELEVKRGYRLRTGPFRNVYESADNPDEPEATLNRYTEPVELRIVTQNGYHYRVDVFWPARDDIRGSAQYRLQPMVAFYFLDAAANLFPEGYHTSTYNAAAIAHRSGPLVLLYAGGDPVDEERFTIDQGTGLSFLDGRRN